MLDLFILPVDAAIGLGLLYGREFSHSPVQAYLPNRLRPVDARRTQLLDTIQKL
jgi:hypothetical protein